MALPALIAKLDEVDEPLRAHYAKLDDGPHAGKFLLQAQARDGFAIEDVSGLRAALADEKEHRRRAKDALAGYVDEDGNALDPAAVKAALKELADRRSKGAGKDTEADRAAYRAEIEAKANKDIAAAKAAADLANARLRKTVRETVLLRELAKHKADPETQDILLKSIADSVQVDFTGDSADPVLRVLDERGNARITSKPGSTQEMGVEEFVGTLKEKPALARFFLSEKTAAGSGRDGASGGSGGGAQKADLSTLSPSQLMDMGRKPVGAAS